MVLGLLNFSLLNKPTSIRLPGIIFGCPLRIFHCNLLPMTNEKATSGGLEWRLTVSDGSTEELLPESKWTHRVWMGVVGLVLALKQKVWRLMEKIWKLGVDDPRRVFHCFKVAVALTVVSLFYYLRPLYNGVGGTAMWAIMTVVVIFEYTVGATLSKGLNRGMATLLAGTLAVGVHSVASQSGERADPIIRGASVFLLASGATFSRFIPTIKTRFDYGVSIFILTFSLVSVSGYRVDELVGLAQQRLSTIAIGGIMCMFISMLVCPVWAGEDLHLLITRNMEKLANSLDGCVTEYFEDTGNVTKEETSGKSQGYKCVLNSKAAEEALANFARWEPAHGRFAFRHPWNQYLKIGTATRYCAYCVEALNSSLNSENKVPESMKKHLSDVCMKLSSHASNVLKELSASSKIMRKSPNMEFLVGEMNNAVEDLQEALKSLPHLLLPTPTEATEKEQRPPPISTTTVALIEVVPLVTVASLLTEIARRIEGVSGEVNKLAGFANFKPAAIDKPKQNQATSKHPSDRQGNEVIKALQEV